ncbi:MAG: sigma-70 family RNA polymerase sigma factor [Myxococcales bacterium]
MPPEEPPHRELIAELFRRESVHLTAALTRLFGPSNLALVEDVVHDALVAAMQAWRFSLPLNPKAWLLQTAKNRAIDVIRRDRRLVALDTDFDSDALVALALSNDEDAQNQLAMMFSICDDRLSQETHVTLILRLLCGLSPSEIARAFLVDAETIDRRLHRGKARLRELGRRLFDVQREPEVRSRLPSVIQALYLLFNEGYQGSDGDNALHPALCADALRLAELLLESLALSEQARAPVHALAAMFCFHAARFPTRLDAEGIFVPLHVQERARWDRSLIERGVIHLSRASVGDQLTRYHLEAGIACEHAIASSLETTNWARIVGLYDDLLGLVRTPIVALNRALAIAELRGLEHGREALQESLDDEAVARYPFLWGAIADLERRAGRLVEARAHFERAIALSRNDAERVAYERKYRLLPN